MRLLPCSLLLAVVTSSPIQGSRLVYHNEDSQPNELDMMELFIGEPWRSPNVLKRSELADKEQKQATGLWFGPRLGRRRRSVDASADTRMRRSIEDNAPAKQTLYLGQDGQWTVMTYGGGKRESNFTPRLGRDLEENLRFLEQLGKLRAVSGGEGGVHGSTTDDSNYTPRLGRLAPLDSH